MNVCCAVLIFSFILWRRLFVSSTNMHTCRSVVLRMHKINMKVSSFSVFCCFAMYVCTLVFSCFVKLSFIYYYQSKFLWVPEFFVYEVKQITDSFELGKLGKLKLFVSSYYWLLISSCWSLSEKRFLAYSITHMYHAAFHFQIAVNGQSFNRSARDAWELFQSTGVEALIAYDCSGAVLLMSTILGGLITGTCTGVWTYYTQSDKAIIVGSTSMLIGMILVGLTVVVVESAVTSIYICYAEDPLLIQRCDPEFFEQISETLHQRLQYRSSRARQILNGRLDHLPSTSSI
ncbi:hypothetical protein ACQ4PT_022728 [Festuca glaucescens]